MALWLQEQRVKVNKIVEQHDKYSVVHLSSSRKDGDKYVYSDWGFVRFVGKANEYLSENVQEKDVLTLKTSYLTKEPYVKDEETIRPKTPQMVVFDCEVYQSSGKSAKSKREVAVPMEEDDSDKIPF